MSQPKKCLSPQTHVAKFVLIAPSCLCVACPCVVDVMPPEVPSSPVPTEEESALEIVSTEVRVEEANVNTVEVVVGSPSIPCLPPKPGKELDRGLKASEGNQV